MSKRLFETLAGDFGTLARHCRSLSARQERDSGAHLPLWECASVLSLRAVSVGKARCQSPITARLNESRKRNALSRMNDPRILSQFHLASAAMTHIPKGVGILLTLLCSLVSGLQAQTQTPAPTSIPVQVQLVTLQDVKQYWLTQIAHGEVAKLPSWARELVAKAHLAGVDPILKHSADWASKFHSKKHDEDIERYVRALLGRVGQFILAGSADDMARDEADTVNIAQLRSVGRVAEASLIEQNILARKRAEEARAAERRQEAILHSIEDTQEDIQSQLDDISRQQQQLQFQQSQQQRYGR